MWFWCFLRIVMGRIALVEHLHTKMSDVNEMENQIKQQQQKQAELPY